MKDSFPADMSTRFFATTLAALGILGLVFGDFAMVWQDVPKWVPQRTALAYACAVLELAAGVGLFVRPARPRVAPWTQAFMVVWLLLLRLPQLIAAPLVEVSWLNVGEIAMLLAGTLAIGGDASDTWGQRTRQVAPFIFGLAAIPCGLAHWIYTGPSVKFMPAFIPAPNFWVLFTGTAYLLAGLALCLRVLDRLAATLVSIMMGCITLGVWLPMLLARPHDRLPWTGLVISVLLWAGGCVVAESLSGRKWIAVPWRRTSI